MNDFCPYFTNDGSIGLYSPTVDDIYHSTYGALTEAYEKFILPADFEKFFENNNQIKILDICFGIGYNSKSFLNFFLEKIFNKKKYIQNIEHNAQIYTDNILPTNEEKKSNSNSIYDDKIHTDNKSCKFSGDSACNNKKFKIFINAIDNDKNLLFISPFLKNSGKNKKMLFKNEKIEKFRKVKVKKRFKLKDEINIILLENLISNFDDFLDDENLQKILTAKQYNQFFDKYMIDLYKYKQKIRYNKTSKHGLMTFLHNIYYRYVSKRHKKALNCLKLNAIQMNFNCEDARMALLRDDALYNFIFLDAFTPSKCPCLWSVDFFKELYNHLEQDGMLLTYSSSASVRHALLASGFYVGKIYSSLSKKYLGTVATKNKLLIKYELSEYDLGLIKSKAGIFYRDENLDALNCEINTLHEKEVEESDLLSSSKFINSYKKSHNNKKEENNYGEVL
ncbi:MAG: MnmC family methyltransferase [Clostridiaceae bacterium]|jgi:tRNA U34 5-methylaminomethyl-2-thiouridine-forming methyltransferase MnmC|nr:MnmC family methyltransferase [Clostridiaceae bacterium]